MSIPALSSVDHPLSYPKPLERQRKYFKLDQNEKILAKSDRLSEQKYSPLVVQKTPQDKMLYLYERQRIVDLCNTYAYTLDSTMMDLKVAEDWANLFTEDCVVTYPFGTHHGREGLAKFGMIAESRFKRMLHIATNFTIFFDSDDIAHGRYACFATHGRSEHDLSEHFMEGGYYYSSFRRVPSDSGDIWKFTNLTLEMIWTLGDSIGLNEPHEKQTTHKHL
ncbi:uncharacterized protein A1O5_05573 [Cladophialophora psammophila CBS 110553]|uniref:SnoaL-like domain-containing protein n=1 Tax=Cladophialophora psammophila CBS 110553 TaxID=1182543 RepID=W9WUW9_9EURO|nr:uncharacterized protein A1O5_05573 [Cladophialophora psammophila CBS 110553]EXJ71763.1 hypothetical protein A1O5_05573 [Cladophialophora psammophila CBS 110553]